MDAATNSKNPRTNRFLWIIGCGMPLFFLVGLSFFLLNGLIFTSTNAPSYYQAFTPSQKFDWGNLQLSIRIPYSADFPREALKDSYKTGIIIEVRPYKKTREQSCLFKPQKIKILETDFGKTLIDQKNLWDTKRGEGSRFPDRSVSQVHLPYLKFDISPDDTSFKMHFNFEIICGAEVNTYIFETNFRRTNANSVNFHIR